MRRMLSEMNADIEAKRLRAEAAMNAPEDRRKAAQMAEAELGEK